MGIDVVSSYEERISEVTLIMENVHQVLVDFKTKRYKTSSLLKDILAREECLRKKDFDGMMRNIFSFQDERENEVRDFLKEYLREQSGIVDFIRENLTPGKEIKIKDFRNILKVIQETQNLRINEIKIMLEAYRKEHKETGNALSGLLIKGDNLRVKEFKKSLKNIRIQQIQRAKEVKEKLAEFSKERRELRKQQIQRAKEAKEKLVELSKERRELLKMNNVS